LWTAGAIAPDGVDDELGNSDIIFQGGAKDWSVFIRVEDLPIGASTRWIVNSATANTVIDTNWALYKTATDTIIFRLSNGIAGNSDIESTVQISELKNICFGDESQVDAILTFCDNKSKHLFKGAVLVYSYKIKHPVLDLWAVAFDVYPGGESEIYDVVKDQVLNPVLFNDLRDLTSDWFEI
jgi:hypothetical protein